MAQQRASEALEAWVSCVKRKPDFQLASAQASHELAQQSWRAGKPKYVLILGKNFEKRFAGSALVPSMLELVVRAYKQGLDQPMQGVHVYMRMKRSFPSMPLPGRWNGCCVTSWSSWVQSLAAGRRVISTLQCQPAGRVLRRNLLQCRQPGPACCVWPDWVMPLTSSNKVAGQCGWSEACCSDWHSFSASGRAPMHTKLRTRPCMVSALMRMPGLAR